MPDIKDPVYLYVPKGLDHPAAGKTVEVEMSEFKANAKEWKKLGIRPATGGELASVQQRMEKKIAGEHAGTAGLMGALSGSTFGLSDLALERMGIVDPAALKQLREENPRATVLGELAGSLAGGAVAARGLGTAVKGGSALARGMKIGSAVGALDAGGRELSRQVGEGSYDLGNLALASGTGAAIGIAVPAAAPLVKKAVGTATTAGLGAVNKGAGFGLKTLDKVEGYTGKLGSAVDEYLPEVLRGNGGGSGAVIGGGQELYKQLTSDKEFDIGDILLSAGKGAVAGKALGSGTRRGLEFAQSATGKILERKATGMSAKKIADQFVGKAANRATRNNVRQFVERFMKLNPDKSVADTKAILEGLSKRAQMLESRGELVNTAKAMGTTPRLPPSLSSEFRQDLSALGAAEAAGNPLAGRNQSQVVDVLKRQLELDQAKKAQLLRAALPTNAG